MAHSSGAPAIWAPPAIEEIAWTFRTDRGEMDWQPPTPLPDVRDLRAVRRPKAGTWSKNNEVIAYSSTTDTTLRLESNLELELLRSLDRDAEIVGLVAQPCRLNWPGPRGGSRSHVPDFLTVDVSGNFTLWDVKPSERVDDPQFVPGKWVATAASVEVGWRYEVFTGFQPIERHNRRWLHAYRSRPSWADWYEHELTEHARTPSSSLGSLLGGRTPEQVAVAWHLVWSGVIHVDLTVRLNPWSEISA